MFRGREIQKKMFHSSFTLINNEKISQITQVRKIKIRKVIFHVFFGAELEYIIIFKLSVRYHYENCKKRNKKRKNYWFLYSFLIIEKLPKLFVISVDSEKNELEKRFDLSPTAF